MARFSLKRPPFLALAGGLALCLFLWAATIHHLYQPSPAPLDSLSAARAPKSPIPKNIWQIFFPPSDTQNVERSLIHAGDWVSLGPDYTYTMMGRAGAASFLDEQYKDRPDIRDMFNGLTRAAMKSDFLRYLLLLRQGGFYGDVDTKPLVALDEWIEPSQRAHVRLIISLEYDQAAGHRNDFKYPAQFCQWTIAAAPGHPVLETMVQRVLGGLQDSMAEHGKPIESIHFSDFDVVNKTGPVAWTEVIFDEIKRRAPEVKSFDDLTGVTEPRYYGDIAVLPSYAFMAEPLDDWGWTNRRCLVRHYFKGAWKTEG